MAATKIADIIIPEVFIPYTIQRTTELSALVQSGIVVPDPQLDELAAKGGTLIQMPFFNDLTGDDEVLSDQTPLTPGKIGTAKDIARLHTRGKAWGVNDLAKALSGADPMKAIADLVADYWNRREQALLFAALNGVFAANAGSNGGDLVHSISIEAGNSATDANLIGAAPVIDAATKLGDAAGKLTAIAMHSVPFSRLQKLEKIEWVPVAEGTDAAGMKATQYGYRTVGGNLEVATYLGKRVIVDDSCPVVAGGTNGFKYTTYLFGQGAVGRGEGQAPVPVETDRDSLQGEDYLIHRRHFLLHPRGIKWNEHTCAGVSPTNAELALAANWTRVYEKKNIRIVKLVTNG